MSRRELRQHLQGLQGELDILEKDVTHCSALPPGLGRRMLVLVVAFVTGYLSVPRAQRNTKTGGMPP